jgi:hypothetical protein
MEDGVGRDVPFLEGQWRPLTLAAVGSAYEIRHGVLFKFVP